MIFENWPPLPIGVGEREHELIYGPNQDMDIASPLMDSPFNLMVDMPQKFFKIRFFFFFCEIFLLISNSFPCCTNWARTPIVIEISFSFGFPR